MQKILLILRGTVILPAILILHSCTPSNAPINQSSPPPASSYYLVSTYSSFSGQYSSPIGLTSDSIGNLYACDAQSGTVWKI